MLISSCCKVFKSQWCPHTLSKMEIVHRSFFSRSQDWATLLSSILEKKHRNRYESSLIWKNSYFKCSTLCCLLSVWCTFHLCVESKAFIYCLRKHFVIYIWSRGCIFQFIQKIQNKWKKLTYPGSKANGVSAPKLQTLKNKLMWSKNSRGNKYKKIVWC